MATNTCTVTGPVLLPDGSAYANKYITFQLVSVGAGNDVGTFPRQQPVSVQTDASGEFSATLWVNGDSEVSSAYEVTFEGSSSRPQFVIPIGTVTIDLGDLIANYSPTGTEP